MPPYDPKANRPKLVPADDPAPVDALLGQAGSSLSPESGGASPADPAPDPVPSGAVASASHLSLVPDAASPRVVPDPPAGRRGDPRVVVALAALGLVAIVGVAVALRRRS